MIDSVIETERLRAQAKGQQIIWETPKSPIAALVDPSILVQVLENLVSNALKYSPPGKHTTVRLEPNNGRVVIAVRDEGPGLTAEDQAKLFGKFARLSAKPTGGESSVGLGLSVAQRMVEGMKGRIWCESGPGKVLQGLSRRFVSVSGQDPAGLLSCPGEYVDGALARVSERVQLGLPAFYEAIHQTVLLLKVLIQKHFSHRRVLSHLASCLGCRR